MLFAEEKDQTPVILNCLITVTVGMIGIKTLHNQAETLSSQFKRGHRKTTEKKINVKPCLHLKTSFHGKAMRNQTENIVKMTVPQKTMRSISGAALETILISLCFLPMRCYDSK